MSTKGKLWIIVATAIFVVAGAATFRALPGGSNVSAAGPRPAPAIVSSSRITLRASDRHPELKYQDSADLAEIQTQSLDSALPADVMTADFNGDGRVDMATSYETPSGPEIRIRFATREGEFGLPQSYSIGAGVPKALASGEFTVDGIEDMVVATGGTLTLMAGTREGDFVHGPSLDLGGDISDLAIHDLDRDGLRDVVAVDGFGNRLIAVFGQGDLSRATPVQIPFEDSGLSLVRIGDFNNDAFGDLAVATSSGLAILYGDGTGGFLERRTLAHSSPVTGLEVGDFNGDHFPDVAVSSAEGLTIWYTRLNKGFSKPKSFYAGEGARGLASGFVNSDDLLDVAVINDGSRVSVMLNRKSGKFSEPMSMDVDGDPVSIARTEIGPYAKTSFAITKRDGRVIVPTVAAAPTINVSTLNDENDCPSCTIAQLQALVPPGGNTGISLREAITAINNSFLINGTTDQGIGFSGILPANFTPFTATTAGLTVAPFNCTDTGATFWILGPTPAGAIIPPILAPGTLVDGTNAVGVTNTLGPKVFLASWGNGIVLTSSAAGSVIRGLGFVGMNGNPAGPPAVANAITVSSNNVKIMDNNIGVHYDGVCIQSNTGVGILLSGTSNVEVTDNIVAGNGIQGMDLTTGDEIQINGISLSIPTPQNNLVSNNLIGVNQNNSGPLVNPGNGLQVQNAATGNTIRDNVIGRNAANGVNIRHNITSNTLVENNKIGVDGSGLLPAPNNTVEGSGVAISAPLSIDPAFPTAVGNSKLNTITQNVISGNLLNGVTIGSADIQAQSNVVASNKIGVDASGSVQIPNGTVTSPATAPPTDTAGVGLTGSANGNRIGGTQLANGNQISGNQGYGVWIGTGINLTSGGNPFNPNNNLFQNNRIGPNSIETGAPFDPSTPADPLPKSNKGGGVLIDAAAFANTLRTNVIAFNTDNTGNGAPVSGITHSSTGNFNRFTQNHIFLNPPDVDPTTPQIVVSAGNEGILNAQINNTALTSLIKIDSAVTTTTTGATTIKGTVNFLDNGISGNINNASIEFFVSRRGAEAPPLADAAAQIRAEGQLFLNSVISFQPNSANANTLDFSAQTTVPAQFIPTDVQTQTVFLTATVTTGDGSTSPFSIGKVPQFVSGGGGGGGCALTANPTLINVLNAPIGQPTNRVLTLSNTGTTTITITGVEITPAGPPWAFDLGGTLPITLNPGDTKNITIGFTPSSATTSTATINITNSCTVTPIAVPLAGSGTSSSVGVSPTTLNFGTVLTTATLSVGVINFGTVPVNVTALAINQAAGTGFGLPNPNPFTIPPQSVVNLAVSFTPTSGGTKNGTLVISTPSATPTSLSVTLTGVGGDSTPPVVAVNAPSAGSTVGAGTAFNVTFGAGDAGGSGLSTFTVALSTDGGATFPFSLGGGTAIEGVNTFNAVAPGGVESSSARIRVQVRDVAGNTGTGMSGNFTIGTPPVLVSGTIGRKFKGTIQNAQPGIVLVIGTETWPLTFNGAVWVVGKPVLSTPSGLRIRAVAPAGTQVTVRVRNPGGLLSAPLTLTAQ
jgi:hypothetical protein